MVRPEAGLAGPEQGEPAAPARRRVRIGRLWIDALTFDEALDGVEALVRAGAGGAVYTPNVDHVVTAEDDEPFAAAYGEASLSLADGQPLVWAARLLGTPLPERVAGSDLVRPLLERAARAGWRVYLLGGGPGVGEEAAARLQRELGLAVVGVDAPVVPADPAGWEDHPSTERLRAARPDLVLVGLGSPKQERYIHRLRPRLGPAVCLGVGASLDFLAGRVRRAPRWVARSGLEWLWRLALEPRRLAGRYLRKDPRFLAVLWRTARQARGMRERSAG